MEIKKLFWMAFLITVIILLGILLIGKELDDSREQYIDAEVQSMYNNINEVQTFFLMSETYGDEMACIAFQKKLRELDRSIWNLGIKLDQYRVASEEFQEDPFYQKQKQIFNENQVVYMMLLTKLKKTCNFKDQAVVSFFYKNSADCKKCDDQSYVLTDINTQMDEQVSIFSYDVDLNITTINLLVEYYNITEFPCVVIEEETHCGMRSKNYVTKEICKAIATIDECSS